MALAAVTAEHIASDVAQSPFALRHGIDFAGLMQVWDNLGLFVAHALRSRKGVLLPTVGNFVITSGKPRPGFTVPNHVVPVFLLLEGRFAAVSQEVPKVLTKGTVAHLNYHVIGKGVRLHRAAVQRVVRDLLARLGSHIVTKAGLQVRLPHVGTMLRVRNGRIQFAFDHDLLSFFGATESELAAKRLLQRQVTVDAAATVPYVEPVTLCVTKGVTPRQQGLLHLAALCEASDPAKGGYVKRLLLEKWLNRECRMLTAQLSAAAVFDLLNAHTYGKSGSFVQYATFIDSLTTTLVDLRSRTPSPVPQSLRQPELSPEPVMSAPTPRLSPSPDATLVRPPPAGPAAAPHQPAVYVGANDPDGTPPGGYEHFFGPNLPPEPCPYFLQGEHPPRNRRDCDEFNRFHFGRLRNLRKQRSVTPKVGIDPLTVYEADYSRRVARSRSPQPSPNQSPEPEAPTPVRAWVSPNPPEPVPHPHAAAAEQPPPGYHHHFPPQHDIAANMQTAQPDAAAQPDFSLDRTARLWPSPHDAQQPVRDDVYGVAGMVGPRQPTAAWAEHPSAAQHPFTHAPANVPAHGTLAPAEQLGHEGVAVGMPVDHFQQSLTLNPRLATASPAAPPRHTPPSAAHAAVAAGVPVPAHWSQQPAIPRQANPQQRAAAAATAATKERTRVPTGNAPADAAANGSSTASLPQYVKGVRRAFYMAKDDKPLVKPSAERGRQSPVKDILNWDRPATASEVLEARKRAAERAANMRASWQSQIEQRAATHDAYASTEDKWPYQPLHRPEGKFPYYNSPRYIKPHYISTSSPLQLGSL